MWPAPQARGLLPVANPIVRNELNQILLVRRADDLYWELPGGSVKIGESGERVYRQFAVCFHVLTTAHNTQPDQDEAIAATWFDPERATQLVMHLVMHPAMHRRLTDALTEPSRAQFD